MKKICKKGLVLICIGILFLTPFISACGKKAPPKPPTKKSDEQAPNTIKKQ